MKHRGIFLSVVILHLLVIRVSEEYKCEADSHNVDDVYLCDGDRDCTLGDDELLGNCSSSTSIQPDSPTTYQDEWLIGFLNKYYQDIGGCGKTSIAPKFTSPMRRVKRMVNGEISVRGSWPWQVALQMVNSPERMKEGEAHSLVFCAGTLIHERWVITAAHCVESALKLEVDQKVNLLFGRFDVTIDEKFTQSISADQMFKHPNHRYPMHKSNDIALIKLKRTVLLNPYVHVACLPTSDTTETEDHCYMTGWGRYSEGGDEGMIYPRQLLQLRFPVVSRERCTRQSAWGPNRISHKQLCAGPADGHHDMCWGDSGGGLVCKAHKGRYSVLGISSFTGHLCAVKNRPAIFTKVAKYQKWIATVIKDHT